MRGIESKKPLLADTHTHTRGIVKEIDDTWSVVGKKRFKMNLTYISHVKNEDIYMIFGDMSKKGNS